LPARVVRREPMPALRENNAHTAVTSTAENAGNWMTAMHQNGGSKEQTYKTASPHQSGDEAKMTQE
jgi:hypothetical protein